MNQIFKPFKQQRNFLLDESRIRGCFAGKRSGKTEIGAIESIRFSKTRSSWIPNGIDPYLGVIIAPTHDMLRRLSLAKFEAYAKPFIKEHSKTYNEYTFKNGAKVLGISADKPQRLEGLKANWIWIDEVFQVTEQLFLESMARVSDQQGHIWCTGSLGVQYINPKAHWAFKHFKESPLRDSQVFEWPTSENPYFPREELLRLQDTLDPLTYRQLFELCWDVAGSNRVFDEFAEANILESYKYNEKLPTYLCIDWGWAHPMACLFFQHDPKTDRVYLFDEIVSSKVKIEKLWDMIQAKGYNIKEWYCDIAGNQEREQTGYSNIDWFRKKGVHFKYRKSAVTYGVAILRSWVKNSKGVKRFYISRKCKKSIDSLLNYSYREKDGMILNELPLKQDGDDAVDAIRYFFVNKFDERMKGETFNEFSRWSL